MYEKLRIFTLAQHRNYLKVGSYIFVDKTAVIDKPRYGHSLISTSLLNWTHISKVCN